MFDVWHNSRLFLPSFLVFLLLAPRLMRTKHEDYSLTFKKDYLAPIIRNSLTQNDIEYNIVTFLRV